MSREKNKQTSFLFEYDDSAETSMPFNSASNTHSVSPKSLLKKDGDSVYFGRILKRKLSDSYLKQLLKNINWKKDEILIYGKHYITERKIAWHGDKHYAYRYSGTERSAEPWTEELLQLKHEVEKHTHNRYNACLLNLYMNGSQGMGWHSDDEKMLDRTANIASLSLGAERRFDFRHNQSKETISVLLEHGSLLVMSGETQSYWKHQLPKTKKITEPRINLTFRSMISVFYITLTIGFLHPELPLIF